MSSPDPGTRQAGTVAGPRTVELAIGGMTCASCAARIEKKLNRVDGVTASVNYATEKARVTFPASLDPQRLRPVVEATGYTAAVPPPPTESEEPGEPGGPGEPGEPAGSEPDAETAGLRQRLTISLALTVPVVLLAMVPPLQFRYWQ